MNKIWWYIPRTKCIYFPLTGVTISHVSSIGYARKIVEKYDENTWKYIVKNKSNRTLYPFATLEDAEAFAKDKCTEKKAYIVYKNGEKICGYIDGTKMRQYKKVFSIRFNIYIQKEHLGRRVREIPIYQHISIADGYLKVTTEYVELMRIANIVKKTKYSKSYTFTADGRCYVYDGLSKSIRQISWAKNSFSDLKLAQETLHALKECLKTFYPDKAWIIEKADENSLLNAALRPTKSFALDTYRKEAVRLNVFGITRPEWFNSLKIREAISEQDLIYYIARKFNVPMSKAFKKLYLKNINNIAIVKMIMNAGIVNVDEIPRCFSLGVKLLETYKEHRVEIKTFLTKLFELRNRNWVISHLEQEDINVFRDCSRMMPRIPEDGLMYIIREAKNFQEIHDSMQHYYNRLTRKSYTNREIEYNDFERNRFNREYGDIRFELAKDSVDLAVVGERMGICVGSYANAAVQKFTTIVKMMKGNKYIACIEVRANEIHQIKAKFNNFVELKYKPFIDEWMNHAKLKVSANCDDYDNMGAEQNRTYNWAVIRAADYDQKELPDLTLVKADASINGYKGRFWENVRIHSYETFQELVN